jgi:EAL domain-containing protein (putative c-di-GMP-specific phosphodiesterase class I)
MMQPPSVQDLLDAPSVHERRVVSMLWVGAVTVIVMGFGWAAFFVSQGGWINVVLDIILMGVGASVMVLIRAKRLRAAFYLMIVTIFSVVCAISLVFDTPTAAAPRTTHHFLLVLAVCSQLFLQYEKPWLRHSIAGVFLAAYIGMASTTFAFHTPYALPDDVRIAGSWVNAGASIVVMYVFIQIMLSDMSRMSSLESEIRQGITRGEFFLVYQPQVTSKSEVVGAEALLRWQHPRLGVVGPAMFISVAEQTGLIVPLGLQSLRTACEILVGWSGQPGMSHLTLSVNVSAQQFRQTDFVSQVQGVLESAGGTVYGLKLELTESLLIQDIEDIVQKMDALRSLGVGFSLDDFGTGYSSLNYLKRLPLDQLKIDQSFVRDVQTSDSDAAIARTVISLGKSMGFAVIAEGVETGGQRQFLMENDCHLFQGYLFSKPLPLQQFYDFVRKAVQLT